MQGEYRGDVTRDTFQRTKHFLRVLQQQGRVSVDADVNEQVAILLHYLQSLGADLIGPHGGPTETDFEIQPINDVANNFQIRNGHYYVDGILCELDANPIQVTLEKKQAAFQRPFILDGEGLEPEQYVEVSDGKNHEIVKVSDQNGKLFINNKINGSSSMRRVLTYKTQPDFPVSADDSIPKENGKCLVYLDVWERHLTFLQDWDGINPNMREVALGGPDTASRSKVIWQVKTLKSIPQGVAISTPPQKNLDIGDNIWRQYVVQNLQVEPRGLLKARIQPEQLSTDVCTISPNSKYRGPENQLYRVEIHAPNLPDATATFKWSRENGSVVFPILKSEKGTNTTTVKLGNLGRDKKLSLNVNDWVEIVDDDYDLLNRAEPLLQIQSIDRDALTVTLSGVVSSDVGKDTRKHPLLRRWDHQQGDAQKNGLSVMDGAALLVENKWLDLEDGVQIFFEVSSKAAYRTGDYWLIPARVATGNIEWPSSFGANNMVVPNALPPHGVEHHYAPLAVISVDAKGKVTHVTNLRRSLKTEATNL